MTKIDADVVVVGAGFAGSLMALVLQRMGREVVLVERGSHPRFAIGESSTPVANLALARLCREYDLPRIMPLAQYGAWLRERPELPCGLKRGFSFFQHRPGQQFRAAANHADELLVGANASVEQGDTHWFRESLDGFFVNEAQGAGIPYFDRSEIDQVDRDGVWRLAGRRKDTPLEIAAHFLIDATGPGGFLARALGIATDPESVDVNSWSVYSHFTDVARWEDVLAQDDASLTDYPFPCDDAALHHILTDGWMWVLRFRNGVISAGVAIDGRKRPPEPDGSAEGIWQRMLAEYPTIGRQFANSRRIRPWVQTGRLQRWARKCVGQGWAMLPHAAYFLDALFSGGNAHTLVGIDRLARILSGPLDDASLAAPLAEYERQVFAERALLNWLIDGCYRTFGRFNLMASFSMYYFAAAIWSEAGLRAGQIDERGFLSARHGDFAERVKRTYEWIVEADSGSEAGLDDESLFLRVADDVADMNPAALCVRAKRNMYPFA